MCDDEENRKWPCEYCTYLNWPSAIKCTLCRASRPAIPAEDIYKLAERQQQSSLTVSSAIGIDDASNVQTQRSLLQKWACSNCTYLNWPKALKCIQCQTARSRLTSFPLKTNEPSTSSAAAQNALPAPVQSSSSSNNGSDSEKSALKQSKTDQAASPPKPVLNNQIQQQRGNITGPHSPRSPPASPQQGTSTQLDSQMIAKKLQKWICAACTYGNWPKATRCVMCYTPRPNGGASASHRRSASDLNDGASPPKQGNLAFPKSEEQEPNESPSSDDEMINMSETDRLWLQACRLFLENDTGAVEAYLAVGGDPMRQITAEDAKRLERYGAFEPGHTLVHLAIHNHREDILPLLLSYAESTGGRHIKRVPCHLSPELAANIRRQIAVALRQRKGEFSCYYFTDITTFSLPSKICDLQSAIQERLFDELLDRDVQKELEEESGCINWSEELCESLGSRLFALWNRTAGDCLLDSVLQATWGVFDAENSLRQALSDSLSDAANIFYPRWKAYEAVITSALQYTLDEDQWARDWDSILHTASKPGSALEQAHIFALAHIIRRPIIVYGVRLVKSYRGEVIGLSNFEGVYLPLLWEPSFCWRSPICLGYTTGHFCALVPMEPDRNEQGAAAVDPHVQHSRYVYVPLMDADSHLLPVHFVTGTEVGHEQALLASWLDCLRTKNGLLVAKMKLHRPPPLVQQMTDDWLEYYQRMNTTALLAVRAQHRATAKASKTVVPFKATHDDQSGHGSKPGNSGGASAS